MTGRRKGRRICGWIMSAAMAFAVWGLITAGIFDKGIYNTSLLNESISSSSFLEQRYDGFETEVQEALRAVNLPEELLGREEMYERFSLDLKKQILGNEAGEPEEWLKQLAQDAVKEYLDSQGTYVTAEAEAGIQALAANLQGMEARYTAVPELEEWRQMQGVFYRERSKAFAGLTVIFLAAAAAAVGIQHRKYRGLQVMGVGGLLGSALAAISFLAVFLGKRAAAGEIAGIFWGEVSGVCLVFCGAGAAVSLCLWMFGKLWGRKER